MRTDKTAVFVVTDKVRFKVCKGDGFFYVIDKKTNMKRVLPSEFSSSAIAAFFDETGISVSYEIHNDDFSQTADMHGTYPDIYKAKDYGYSGRYAKDMFPGEHKYDIYINREVVSVTVDANNCFVITDDEEFDAEKHERQAMIQLFKLHWESSRKLKTKMDTKE